MKKLKTLIVILIIIGLLFPVANLVIKADNAGTLSRLQSGNGSFQAMAPMLEEKCAGCHVPDAALPFYASFPVASGMIRKDIDQGIRFFDMTEAFAADGGPVSQTSLAKMEHVTAINSMPPLQYRALHWGSGMGDSDKESVGAWIAGVRARHFTAKNVAPAFKNEVVQPLSPPEGLNPEMVALGDQLYHENRLSGDDTISCAFCHGLDTGGTDQLQFSKGIDNQVGGINAPTVYNAVFALRQFWDGRAADLKEQAGGPVTNPIEMGAQWPEVIAKLEKDDEYAKAFASLFKDGITADSVQTAIAEFEKTLVTTGSKFDRYLQGEGGTITVEEKEGYGRFKALGCATCHPGQAVGGESFEYMGLRKDYFADRGNVKEADHGLFNFTKKEKDRFKFKVPTLRNLPVTFPYFHDGSTSDLNAAVRLMGEYQCGVSLSESDQRKIVAFLKTLTGMYKGELLK